MAIKKTADKYMLRVGDKVLLQGKHPWKGSEGVVIAIKPFMGKPSAVVRLKRNDAMDGHEVGVTDAKDIKKL